MYQMSKENSVLNSSHTHNMEYCTFEKFPLARDLSLTKLFRKFNALSPTNKKRIISYISKPDSSYGRAVISKLLDIGGGKGVLEFYPDIQFVINNNEQTVRQQIDKYNELVTRYNRILEGGERPPPVPLSPDPSSLPLTPPSSPEEFIPIDIVELDKLALEIQECAETLSGIPGFYGPDYGSDGHRVYICRECNCAIKKGRGQRDMTQTEKEHKQMRLKTLEEMQRTSSTSPFDCEGDFCGWSTGWLCASCQAVKNLPKEIEELKMQTKIPISWEECKCKRLERDGHI